MSNSLLYFVWAENGCGGEGGLWDRTTNRLTEKGFYGKLSIILIHCNAHYCNLVFNVFIR